MAIGIIGGTGVYDPKLMTNVVKKKIHTPYGATSDLVTIGKFKGKKVVFIPRHGSNHEYPPHQVNYRANIWAMQKLGVTRILAPGAVGSLKKEIKPGDFVFSDQFIDRTYGRGHTFYEQGQICHISVAEPFCPELRQLLVSAASRLKVSFHEKGICIVINGPRFSTKAESHLYRSWDADIINMTMCPEVVLAREAEICYANIAMVTDYDCWYEHHVTSDEVVETMKQNIEKVKRLLTEIIPLISEERKCACKDALQGALL
ncbi:S-methyl-5'-thioadenosine phosphorylase [Candidatus Woesearchaeota archaeon]|nr:S-methyl-5'-thioadenosine phosphorylase [Candidatus Woesearchaeota archaeon]